MTLEKKIVKKKMGDMSDEEIEQIADKICDIIRSCDNCPFSTNRQLECALNDFHHWRDNYFKFKDKEFEIEVEE